MFSVQAIYTEHKTIRQVVSEVRFLLGSHFWNKCMNATNQEKEMLIADFRHYVSRHRNAALH